MPQGPPPGRAKGPALIQWLVQQVQALATQQQFVITDPTQQSGDPAHGYAVFVIGNLRSIGINAFGAASYRTSVWVQL